MDAFARPATIPTPLLNSQSAGGLITPERLERVLIELDAVEAAGALEGLKGAQRKAFTSARTAAMNGTLTNTQLSKLQKYLKVAHLRRILAATNTEGQRVSVKLTTGSMRGFIQVRIRPVAGKGLMKAEDALGFLEALRVAGFTSSSRFGMSLDHHFQWIKSGRPLATEFDLLLTKSRTTA
jgi:hypothetical protein